MKILDSQSTPPSSARDTVSDLPEMIHLGLGWIGDRGGGLERYQHGICAAHADMGCRVTAWLQSGVPIDGEQAYPIVSYSTPTSTRRSRIASLRRLADERFAGEPFLLVSHHASVSSSLARVMRHRPHVVHFQGPWAEEAQVEGARWWKTAVQRRHELQAYHSADCVITLSEAFRKIAIERYGIAHSRVKVVPGGIDMERRSPRVTRTEAREILGWPTDRPIVLSVRRLVRRVGLQQLVEAIAEVVRIDDSILLMIGGTGPLEGELRERVRDLGLEANVTMLGFIDEDELPFAYRAADWSIVPTQQLEGFGLVVIESLAAGTPALVTPVGSLPEVVSGLNESLVLKGMDPHAIGDGLLAVMRQQVEVPSDTQCQDFVLNHYDWSVIAPRVLDVYRQALGSG